MNTKTTNTCLIGFDNFIKREDDLQTLKEILKDTNDTKPLTINEWGRIDSILSKY